MLTKTLKLEGATLTVRPNSRCSSRHRSTQREVGGTHEHDQQIHDHDSDGLKQERNEGKQELRLGSQSSSRQMIAGNIHHTEDTPRKCDGSGLASPRYTEPGG